MNLQNIQFDRIMREYDSQRMEEAYRQSKRQEEIYARLPRVKELDDAITDESISAGKAAVLGNPKALEGLESRLELLANQRRAVLVENGYPSDYLDLHYNCPLCMDTGFIGKEYCSCFRAKLSKCIYDETNIRELIKKQNFSAFNFDLYSNDPSTYNEDLGATPYENIVNVVDKVKRYIRDFDTNFVNLFIFGETGLGKTFLTNCIAKELLDSAHTVQYYPSYALFNLYENYRFRRDEYEKYNAGQYEKLFDCDLLIIDDLLSELLNSQTLSFLYSIINERILRKKSTVISTNLTPAAIKTLCGERIYSRIAESYEVLTLIGDDLRQR